MFIHFSREENYFNNDEMISLIQSSNPNYNVLTSAESQNYLPLQKDSISYSVNSAKNYVLDTIKTISDQNFKNLKLFDADIGNFYNTLAIKLSLII